MDKEDVLRERINSLIDNELLSVEMLQEATGIERSCGTFLWRCELPCGFHTSQL